MPNITKEITIDFSKSNTLGDFDGIIAKQGDKSSRYLKVQFTNENVPVPIEKGSTVALNALKPDGTRTCTFGSVNDDGTVRVELSGQTLTVEGPVDCDVSIIGADGSKLTSTTFLVNVMEAAVTDEGIESLDDYSVLTELILQVKDFTTAEAARAKNETARQEAETERVKTNNAVKDLIDSFVGNIPIANTTTPGCVKSGGDISVDKNGNVTLNNTAVDQVLTQLYPKGITSQIKLGSMTKQPVNGLVTFTAAEIAATHNHATSGTTGGVYWVKYEEGTCILCGSVSKNELTLNELSGTYNKKISFPFTLYGKPTPSVTAIYAQGIPIVGCINISATEITVGSKDNVDNMKISWTVTARWKA